MHDVAEKSAGQIRRDKKKSSTLREPETVSHPCG